MTEHTPPATALEARWGASSTWHVGWHLRHQAAERPDSPYLAIGTSAPQTYAEVAASAEVVAGRLWSLGLRAGDPLLFFLPTSFASVHGWLGAKLVGLVDVPLNDAYRGESLVHAVNLSGARVVLTTTALLPELERVQDRLTTLTTVVLTDGPAPEPARSDGAVTAVALDTLPVEGDWVPASPAHSDLSTVLLTSGTTGPAKGVMMTNAQTHTIARECAEGLRVGPDDVFYCFHPLFHMAGRFGALYAAMVMGTRTTLDVGFTPDSWVDRLRETGATVSIAHGPMIEMVHATPRRPDDADNPLRAVIAAPLPAAIGVDFEERFGVLALETWGMTEVTACCWRPYDAPLRLGAAGKALDDLVEIVVVDPATDEPVPPGRVGEITVVPRHPWLLMQGYLGMPEETVRAWRNLRFHSGDAGYLDEDGWLFFVDRLGDRIRRKAENISSYDIEVAASTHPGVVEVAAVGVPVTPADDEIKVVVSAEDGFDPEALFRHLVAELPHHMVPRYVEQLSALPRTPTNKVRKRELRERGVTPETWDYKAVGLSIRALREQDDPRPPVSVKGSTA